MIGTPATVEYRASGTIVSPWPPSTNACVSATLTPSSSRDERPEPRRVQDAGHADHAFSGEPRCPHCDVAHRIEGICHHDQYGVGRVPGRLFDDGANDSGVLGEQVIATHARLPGETGGHHDDVAAGRIGVVVRAGYSRVMTDHRR